VTGGCGWGQPTHKDLLDKGLITPGKPDGLLREIHPLVDADIQQNVARIDPILGKAWLSSKGPADHLFRPGALLTALFLWGCRSYWFSTGSSRPGSAEALRSLFTCSSRPPFYRLGADRCWWLSLPCCGPACCAAGADTPPPETLASDCPELAISQDMAASREGYDAGHAGRQNMGEDRCYAWYDVNSPPAAYSC
jgi:hypothetical protein